ncbi:MAG TPA: NUDIX hydrolase [Syntrophorhabdaceae bacterium]|nr:NUDIX hydrolase [Syntrophorhabdaceae bacterium]
MIKEWQMTESRVDRDYRVFRIKSETAISPRTEREGRFYTIETNDWVNIIPITADEKMVMIRQYRHGSKRITLEIPGGLVDENNSKDAALRELQEETGYAGDEVELLGSVNPNPAIFGNSCHTYLVRNARKIYDIHLDPDEDIDVVLVPIRDVPLLVRNGEIDHALVIVAFHFYFMKYPPAADGKI